MELVSYPMGGYFSNFQEHTANIQSENAYASNELLTTLSPEPGSDQTRLEKENKADTNQTKDGLLLIHFPKKGEPHAKTNINICCSLIRAHYGVLTQ